jgi:hypothetical protein
MRVKRLRTRQADISYILSGNLPTVSVTHGLFRPERGQSILELCLLLL